MPPDILWRFTRGKKKLFQVFLTHLRSENLLMNTLAECYHLKLLLKILWKFHCKEKAIPLQPCLNKFGVDGQGCASESWFWFPDFFFSWKCVQKEISSHPVQPLLLAVKCLHGYTCQHYNWLSFSFIGGGNICNCWWDLEGSRWVVSQTRSWG